MQRRTFLLSGTAVLGGAPLAAVASPLEQRLNQREYLDCGFPGSETCLAEAEANAARDEGLRQFRLRRDQEIERILAAETTYDRHFEASTETDPVKLIRGGIFDFDNDIHRLRIKVVALQPYQGEKQDRAMCEVFRKTGWGRYISVSAPSDLHSLQTKDRRTYRVRNFTGDCLVLWSSRVVASRAIDPPVGCYPANSAGCD